MGGSDVQRSVRLPRLRRASEPPAFRLTDGDVEIIRQVARRRLIRSTHIAALVGRSVDRTNDRLKLLFHAGYLDRPLAQFDRFPTGSSSYVYALANRGARLLCEREGACCNIGDWSYNNRRAGRPFIEHQVEIVNFEVVLRGAVRQRPELTLLTGVETIIPDRQRGNASGNPFALRTKLSYAGWIREARVIPDFVFSLIPPRGERFNFMVEIDRGKMPIRRSDPDKTSFEQKMRVYLSGHGARQHERQVGWKNFRVLSVTTDRKRLQHMQETLRDLPHGRGGPSLFLFSTYEALRTHEALNAWQDAAGRPAKLL